MKGKTEMKKVLWRRIWLLTAIFAVTGAVDTMVQAEDNPRVDLQGADQDWSQLVASMDKMHMAMAAIQRSGKSDVDFVRLMLPHHQAAVDRAKTQLTYGNDPQMRRLALEIITDQQLEIELMQRWLKQQEEHGKAKSSAAVGAEKTN